MTRGLLVLDLDGTLVLGDAPVEAYGREAVDALPEQARGDAAARIAAFLAGDRDAVPGARDGYQAVARAARAAGADRDDLEAAFHRSRAAREGWLHAVRAPTGAVAVLGALDGVRRVVATNSPSGVPALLEHVGLSTVVDDVIEGAGKPDGMPAVLDRFGVPGARIAGMGDIWINDLAEIAARGGTTLLIDRHGLSEGEPTVRGRVPEELLPAITEWAAALPD